MAKDGITERIFLKKDQIVTANLRQNTAIPYIIHYTLNIIKTPRSAYLQPDFEMHYV